jgi:ankyrin repeat protein
MPLLNLPTELILMIEDYLPTKYDVHALMRCHTRMAVILQKRLYNRAEGSEINRNLIWACEKGDEGLASAMLSMGADITTRADGLFEPLALAILYGHLSLVKLLLKHDPSAINTSNAGTGESCTALMSATIAGNKDMVRLLLAQPQLDLQKSVFYFYAYHSHPALNRVVPKNNRFDLGICHFPIDYAILVRNEELVQILLADSRVKLSPSALVAAVAGGNEHMVRLCLLQNPKKACDEWSLVLIAADKNHTSILRLLLQVASQSSLVECKQTGFISAADLENQIEINTEDSIGQNALFYAAQHGNVEMMKMLLDTGEIDINHPDYNGKTPLSLAPSFAPARGGEAVKFLLSWPGVEPNRNDWQGRTPFHNAALCGDVEAMIALLSTGKIDVNQPDNRGHTALSLAAGNKVPRQLEVMRLLLSFKDILADVRDCEGRTPLLLAANNGDLRAVRHLLATGLVDPEAVDCYRNSLFFYALMTRAWNPPWRERADERRDIYEMLKNRIHVHSDVSRLYWNRGVKWKVPRGLVLLWHLLSLDYIDPHAWDPSGQTPLFSAVKRCQVDAVRLLLMTRKVDPEMQNQDGWSPLPWVEKHWHVNSDFEYSSSESEFECEYKPESGLNQTESEADFVADFEADSEAEPNASQAW